MILLSPLCLAALSKLASSTPIAARLALRDLGRYRARSGSALSAIALGVMIAALVCILAAGRYGNVLDYAGPNVTSSQLIVYTAGQGPGFGPGDQPGPGAPSMAVQTATANSIAAALGSHDAIALENTSASLQHAAAGRQWSGPVYVATPQLLAAFGIKASQLDPTADILSMRPGLSGISLMQLVYGNYYGGQGGGQVRATPVTAQANRRVTLARQVAAWPTRTIEEVGALPSGTSAPNTVITEYAVHKLGLQQSISGWLVLTPHPLTASQISSARVAAAAKGMTIETRNSQPASSEIINWATVFGIVLALGILGMSVGLIRAETASDLRTLTATGAGGSTRRTLTAVTAGALGFTGAVLGTAAAYVASIAYSFDNKLDGLGSLKNIPTTNLLIILIGMPLVAAAVGWLVAGREPSTIARQPLG